MDNINLGQRLSLLRKARGLAQDLVERATGLPSKAISNIEQGKRGVSTLELAKLAEFFCVPVSDFFTPEGEEDLFVALYRAAPSLELDPQASQDVVRCIQICQEAVFLEDLLEIPGRQITTIYPFGPPSDRKTAILQGEEAAKQERRRLELGDSSIHNLVDLLTSQGVLTAPTNLPDEISGLIVRHPRVGMAIIVNERHPVTRRRFSYAHEYAHAVLDPNHVVAISGPDSDLIEMRANAFAAAFLVPKEGLESFLQLMGKGEPGRFEMSSFDPSSEKAQNAEIRQSAASQKISGDVVALIAHHFGVSYQTAVYRLLNLRYIKGREKDELLSREEENRGKDYLKVFGFQDGDHSNEASNKELTAKVGYLAIQAYQREVISRGRLLDLGKLLGISGTDLLRLAETENHL